MHIINNETKSQVLETKRRADVATVVFKKPVLFLKIITDIMSAQERCSKMWS